ncbi:MAG TPA: glutathione S-transferase family protein [Candidatus Cybelea sp.]|nr:glutathione S-transferase family protein [Candidatus Cybelea sp.]
MADIILHHYETSPYSEKVRLALGLKGLAWKSVQIPRIMPKPDLMPLTGGYRKTPVMQVGADIYCDTQLIMREIERRHPKPSLYPAGPVGTTDALAWWAEKAMFTPAVILAFANIAHTVPEDFKKDRAAFSGRNFDPAAMKAMLPYMTDQLRAHLGWIEATLAAGRKYLQGEAVGTGDLAAYHCVWFIQRNIGPKAKPLDEFPKLLDWAARIAALGHGKPSEMSSKDALAVAKAAKPEAASKADAHDPAARKPGQKVSVTPDDTGKDPVVGELVASSAQEIAIRRSDPQVGEVVVHFPRAGFVVAPA